MLLRDALGRRINYAGASVKTNPFHCSSPHAFFVSCLRPNIDVIIGLKILPLSLFFSQISYYKLRMTIYVWLLPLLGATARSLVCVEKELRAQLCCVDDAELNRYSQVYPTQPHKWKCYLIFYPDTVQIKSLLRTICTVFLPTCHDTCSCECIRVFQ